MADPRFFFVAGPFTLQELAGIADAELNEGSNPQSEFTDVAPLDTAEAAHIGFLDNKLYTEAFSQSRAGACLVHPDLADRAPEGMALLLTKEPYHGFARISRAFYPLPEIQAGIDDGAAVDETAVVGDGTRIESGAVIGPGAEIGSQCLIGANTVIGSGVIIGQGCQINASVTVANAIVGERVIIHSGARIGQDGFGFALGPEGHLKVPQLGRVMIGDDVEIGANTTIDRGSGPDTVIGTGTIIDNLVQIAHNVQIGKGCVIVSHVGISGSTKIGDFVMIGGQAGFAGHLVIGSGARIGAQSGVIRSIEPGVTVQGSPAQPAKEFWKQVALLARMAKKKKKD